MMDSKSVRNIEFFTKIKLRNSASYWLLLQEVMQIVVIVSVLLYGRNFELLTKLNIDRADQH
jgi:hypothetical protein